MNSSAMRQIGKTNSISMKFIEEAYKSMDIKSMIRDVAEVQWKLGNAFVDPTKPSRHPDYQKEGQGFKAGEPILMPDGSYTSPFKSFSEWTMWEEPGVWGNFVDSIYQTRPEDTEEVIP